MVELDALRGTGRKDHGARALVGVRTLKHDYASAPLRVRGIDRVTSHADLTMLARLAQALSGVRVLLLAA